MTDLEREASEIVHDVVDAATVDALDPTRVAPPSDLFISRIVALVRRYESRAAMTERSRWQYPQEMGQ